MAASETGTACSLARDVILALSAAHDVNTIPLLVDQVDIAELLQNDRVAIFVVSTAGFGEFPRSALGFWDDLNRLGVQSLDNFQYTVFGLGDRRYKHFNHAGRKLHGLLRALGANEIHPLGLGDDSDDFGVYSEFDAWLDALLETVGCGEDPDEAVRDVSHAVPLPRTPLLATVISNEQMTDDSAHTEVRRLHVMAANLEYDLGDSLAVYPVAEAADVRSLIIALDLHPDSLVGEHRLFDLLSRRLDISATPDRTSLRLLSLAANDTFVRDRLVEMSSRTAEGKKLFYDYVVYPHRDFADVISDFAGLVTLSVEDLVRMLPPTRPRSYSIASSPLEAAVLCDLPSVTLRRRICPSRWCSLLVAVKTFPFSKLSGKRGLSSCYLKSLVPGNKVACYVEKSHLLIPEKTALDTLVVATGTGCALGRAIARDRALRRCMGLQTSPLRLYFGFRNPRKDCVASTPNPVMSHVKADVQRWTPEGDSCVLAFSQLTEADFGKSDDTNVIKKHHVTTALRLLPPRPPDTLLICGRSHPMPEMVLDELQSLWGAEKMAEMQRRLLLLTETWG